jgi:hypothetical protein
MRIITLAKYRRAHDARPSDGKARIGFSNEYMYNVMQLLHDYTRHTRTLPVLTDLEASRETHLRNICSIIEAITET